MPNVRYIYLLKDPKGEVIAAFTVVYEAIAFAAQNHLDPFSYSLERVLNGKKARAQPVKDWEKAREVWARNRDKQTTASEAAEG